MSLTVTQRPNQFNSWVAGFNPVLYKMQRKDFGILSVANSGGALQITVDDNLATLTTAEGGPVVAGSILYVRTNDLVYDAFYTVVTCTSAANSVITFTAGTYTSASTTGFVNLEQRTGYRVDVEIYAGSGAASSTALFTMQFVPDKYGLLTMDISTLHNYLSPEIESLTVTAQTTLKTLKNDYTSYEFYIKYREVWTSSAESQTSDTANRSYITMASRQIGGAYGGYLKEYSEATGRKFLNLLDSPKIWKGRKFPLSFIDATASATSRTHVKKSRYYQSGVLWGHTYDLASSTLPSINENIESATTPVSLLYDQQDGAGVSWGSLSSAPFIILSATQASKYLIFPIGFEPGTGTRTINFKFTTSTSTGVVLPSWELVDLSNTVLASGTFSSLSGSVETTRQADISLSGLSGTSYFFKFLLTHTSGSSFTTTINYIRTEVPEEGHINYSVVTLTKPAFPITLATISEVLTVDIVDEPCEPAIQLVWNNSLGGWHTWIFENNQQQTMKIKDNKNKRFLCYADGLTDNELDVLDELNSIGELYNPAIIELSSSVNKTQARTGQQVYLIDSAGTKTGVVIIPSDYRTRTKQRRHSIEILVEMPNTLYPS